MAALRRRVGLLATAAMVAVAVVPVDAAPVFAVALPLPGPGVTSLVSASSSGAANKASFDAAVSDDGRFVAFSSMATDLAVLPTGGSQQVFVRDMSTGIALMVSVNSSGAAGGHGNSHNPSISSDGRFVAFASEATDLDGSLPLTDDHTQIYIRDLSAGTTRLVTRNVAGTAGGKYNSYSPSLSGDGTRLVFGSIAPDLLAGAVGGGKSQIFTAETVAGSMTVVGIISTGDATSATPGQAGDDDSYSPSISRDGSAVVFTTASTNLTADTLPVSTDQIFLHSMETGHTRLVSLAGSGHGGGDADSASSRAALSADGRRVAFTSKATNLATNSPHTAIDQVYLRDMSQSSSELLSAAVNGAASTGRSLEASISGDGRRVAFSSNARDLVLADTRSTWQVYWREVATRATMLVSSSAADPTQGAEDPNGSSGSPFSAPRLSSDGQRIAFSAAAGLLGPGSPGPQQVYLQGLRGSAVDRVGGADRYAVSAAVSAATFPPGVLVAYVASGAVFSDALSGSAAAGAQGAPVLLVTKDAVPESIAAELRRLHPKAIVVLGGLNTISQGVETALAGFGAPVSRIAGADRYAVSAAISAASFSKGTTAYVASGEVFPDALSGSAAAGLLGGPVLLVSKNAVPASVSAELKRLAPNVVVVLGGESTVSAAVSSELAKQVPTIRRIGGADRFEVSASISQDAFPSDQHVVLIASGAVFSDALSGSAAAIAHTAPVLLVTKDAVPASVITQLQRLKPYRITVLGGPDTISDTVRDALEKYLAK